MTADPSRLWNEAWAISKDLGKITGDLCVSCGRTLADSLTIPFQDQRILRLVGAAMACDQQIGRLGMGWPGADEAWGPIEDPLATSWDDVVSRPIVPLPDPLLATQHVNRQRRSTA